MTHIRCHNKYTISTVIQKEKSVFIYTILCVVMAIESFFFFLNVPSLNIILHFQNFLVDIHCKSTGTGEISIYPNYLILTESFHH